jgi:hypothetical protein
VIEKSRPDKLAARIVENVGFQAVDCNKGVFRMPQRMRPTRDDLFGRAGQRPGDPLSAPPVQHFCVSLQSPLAPDPPMKFRA